MRFTSTLAVAATLAAVNAASKGFNYGAFFGNDAAKGYVDFKYEFEAAQELPGTNGEFTSARLYTMIQHGTTSDIITAIQAAIDTKTELLLGLWASAGQAIFNNEVSALKAAIAQYGTAFTDLVVGISVGSEDLYRITPTAISNGETNPGAQPSELVNYINQVRSAIAGTSLAGKPVGHVDTWTAYDNATNAGVVESCDFIGVDIYSYWEVQHDNSIGVANATFYEGLQKTKNASQGKPVWVTETGWPVSGPTEGQAVASAENAGIYWEDVTCSLLAQGVNLWYYTLQDVQYSTPSPSFGLKPGGDLKAVSPLFDLTCSSSSVKPTGSITPTASATALPVIEPTASTLIVSTPNIFPSVVASTGLPGFVWPTRSSIATLPTPTQPVRPSIIWPQNVPRDLTQPFVAPYLISPIDASDPSKVVHGYHGELSPTRSTLFAMDIPFTSGKTCILVFSFPVLDPQFPLPYHVISPGGISVSRLNGATLGSVSSLIPGNKYVLQNAPCAMGRLELRMDSVGGLDMTFFQLAGTPALGLFMEIS